MLMQSTESLWHSAKQKLSNIQLKSGEFHLVRIDESSEVASYCGMDEGGRLFLAFRTSKRSLIPELKTSAFDSYISQRPDKTWLYMLRLVDNKLSSVFETLCIDLYNEVSTTDSEDAAIHLLKKRVRSWEKLFAASFDGLLSRSQVIGLIGELNLLLDLIESGKLPPASALAGWQGPYGSDQDFIFADSAIETKTIRDNLNEVSISNLEQLNTDRFPVLQLVVNRYRDVATEDPNAISLNSLTSRLVSKFTHDPILLREFNTSMLEAGYVHHGSYDQLAIAIIQKDAYSVTADFPRLMPSMVMNGVTDAKYHVSLLSTDSFKLTPYPYGNN